MMANTDQLDDKTLAILMVIGEIMEKKHDAKHILTMYERALEKVKDYRTLAALPSAPQDY